MEAKEFEKYKGKRTFGFVGSKSIDGCIVIGYDSIRNGSLIVGCYDSRGWICLLTTDVVDENLKRQFESFLYVNVENVKIEKDLGLTSILKGCEGVELWSDICGACKLDKINKDGLIRVVVCKNESIGFNFLRDGRFYDFEGAKCLLWPSETNRDWDTFVAPVKVRDDDWVVCCDCIENGSAICKYGKLITDWKYIIPYNKFDITLNGSDLKRLSII